MRLLVCLICVLFVGIGCTKHGYAYRITGTLARPDGGPLANARLLVSDSRVSLKELGETGGPSYQEYGYLVAPLCVTDGRGEYRATLYEPGGSGLIYTAPPPAPYPLVWIHVFRDGAEPFVAGRVPAHQDVTGYCQMAVRMPRITVPATMSTSSTAPTR